MKKSVMLGVWMLSATFLFAQHHSKDAEQRASRHAERMKTELSLNDDQFASVKTINKKYANRHIAIRRDSSMTRDQKYEQFKDLRMERKEEIESVLTPDQKVKWEVARKKRTEKMREKAADRKAKRDKFLKEELALTDDQQTKMETARKSVKGKLDHLRANTSLSKDEKHAEMKQIRAEYESSVRQVLTDEQFNKWQQLKERRKDRHKRRQK